MADLSGFDANQVEPTGDFQPIPAGEHVGVITASEMKANKAGTGSFRCLCTLDDLNRCIPGLVFEIGLAAGQNLIG